MYRSFDEIYSEINSTQSQINRFVSTYLKKYNVTFTQWAVLKQLYTHNQLYQKELCYLTKKDEASLTRILDLLEKKGLVERRINQEDRRSFLIHLNKEGIRVAEMLNPIIEKLYTDQIFINITNELLEDLDHTLSQLRKNTSLENLI